MQDDGNDSEDRYWKSVLLVLHYAEPDQATGDPLDAAPVTGEGTYPRLVDRTLRATITHHLDRTARSLGARFDQEVTRFLSKGLPTSRYLRDVPALFVEDVLQHWPDDPDIPAWAHEMADYEAATFRVSAAPDPPELTPSALTLESRIAFSHAAIFRRYEHAVHEDAAARPTHLVIYRTAAFEIETLEVSALEFAILEQLRAGAPVKTAISESVRIHETELLPDTLKEVARLIADFAARRIFLGAEPP